MERIINIKNKFQIDIIGHSVGTIGLIVGLFMNRWIGMFLLIASIVIIWQGLSRWDREHSKSIQADSTKLVL